MKIEIKNSHLNPILSCLQKLDKPPTEGAKPYKLKANIRYQIGRSQKKFQGYCEGIAEIRDPVIRKFLEIQNRGLETPVNNFVDYDIGNQANDELKPLYDSVEERTVYQIKLEDLDLDTNPIPAEVWSPLLGVIITDKHFDKETEEEPSPGDPPENEE